MYFPKNYFLSSSWSLSCQPPILEVIQWLYQMQLQLLLRRDVHSPTWQWGKYFLSLHQTNHNWKVQTWDWNHASTASDQSDAIMHLCFFLRLVCKASCKWHKLKWWSKYDSNWSKIAEKCIPLKVVHLHSLPDPFSQQARVWRFTWVIMFRRSRYFTSSTAKGGGGSFKNRNL